MEPIVVIFGFMAAIPVVAIALGIGHKMFERMLESQEKRLEMKLRLTQEKDTSLKEQLDALRAEVASIRDTSTQYDMALDRTLQGLTDRMQAMEQGRRAYPTNPSDQGEQIQKIGRS